MSAADSLLFPGRFLAARRRFHTWESAEISAFQQGAARRVVRSIARSIVRTS